MRLGWVVPRYGEQVAGGAEHAVRNFAERLAASGWSVEVLTTCAVDSVTWAPELAPGRETLSGVQVTRFPNQPRDERFGALCDEILDAPAAASADAQRRFVDWQGPASSELVEAVGDWDGDALAFSPYLFDPTVRGIGRSRTPAILHPAAHDEPPIHLPLYDDVFAAADALVFYSRPEQRFVFERFPQTAARPQLLLGLGVARGAGDPAEFRGRHGLGDDPYLFWLGRVDEAKGAHLAAGLVKAYKARRPGPLKLVLAGAVHERPPDHHDVVVTGPVSDADKWGGFAGAEAVLVTSPYESFSFSLFDGWLTATPALVNGRSPVTAGHCRRSGGGLVFGDYPTFEVALDRLLADRSLRHDMGRRGQGYVERWFTWDAVVERYRGFVERIAG